MILADGCCLKIQIPAFRIRGGLRGKRVRREHRQIEHRQAEPCENETPQKYLQGKSRRADM